MHPVFQISNVAKLPQDLKSTAMAALQGSLPALARLPRQRVAAQRLPNLTPVYYEALDTSAIDDLMAAMESGNQIAFTNLVSRPILGLLGFLQVKGTIPKPAYPELWPRLWTWITLLDSLRSQVPLPQYTALVPCHPSQISIIALAIAEEEASPECHLDEEEHSEGLLRLAGSIWAELLDAAVASLPPKVDILGGATALAEFAGGLRKGLLLSTTNPDLLSDLAAAVGSWDMLAQVIVRHLELVLSEHSSPNPLSNIHTAYLQPIAIILNQTYMNCYLLRRALAAAGVVPVLVRICRIMASFPLPHGSNRALDKSLVFAYFYALTQNFWNQYPHTYVIQALQAGFVDLLFELAAGPHFRELSGQIKSVLTEDLPGSLAYASVLRALAEALNTASPAQVAAMDRSGLGTEWQDFLELFHERANIFNARKSIVGLHSCDNFECTTLGEGNVKRCAGCLTTFYCSKTCQSADWGSGHREECPVFALFNHTTPTTSQLQPESLPFYSSSQK
ncbi:MYND-type domain-containing protein [Mycena kentingensis (nom. inval.)]|nr:MYND-type domain-containing protein [Mycena kentingensis (nom. inval.)]